MMSVLGLNSGYTVKYNPLPEFPQALPSGTSSGKGLYLTVYPSSRPNTDTVCSNKLAEVDSFHGVDADKKKLLLYIKKYTRVSVGGICRHLLGTI